MKKLFLIVLLLFYSTELKAQNSLMNEGYVISTTAGTAGTSKNLIGKGIGFHRLSWNTIPSVNTCSIVLQQSVDGSTWTDLIAATTCTSSGVATITAGNANYIRPNATTFTGNGRLEVRWDGYLLIGGGSDGSGGPGGSDTQVQFNDAGAFGGDSAFTFDKTSSVLTVTNYFTTNEVNATDSFGASAFNLTPNAGLNGNSGFGSQLVTPANSTNYPNYLNGVYSLAYHSGSGTVGHLYGHYYDVENFGGGTVVEMVGTYPYLFIAAGSPVTTAYGVWVYLGDIPPGAVFGTVYGYSFTPPSAGTVGTAYIYHSDNIAGVATNGYYQWFDSRGVYRIREDNIVDPGNAQAVPALYNPRFTKYTAGAANYERIVQQWDTNVAEIGTEAGGTGTQRALRLLASSIAVSSSTLPVTGGISAVAYAGSSGTTILKLNTPTSCAGAGCALATGALDSSGKVTTTTTGAASIAITFSTAFSRAPACNAVNETTANLLRATSTTTTVTIAGVTVNGDTLAWTCLGG